jgi:adenosylmethionine-8-amino-7-oxononanoate aminotransferase
MHGPTFMANPLACAAALASTGLLVEGGGRGVWLRPFRDLVYTMPPYVADDEETVRVAEAVLAAARAGAGG